MASVWRELKRRNVVRVVVAYAIVSWLILQLTDVLMPLLSLPEWVGRFVFLLLVVGFLLALFVSWAYELTPEGLKKEKDIDRSESITHITGRKLDFMIIGMLVVALGYFAFDKFVLDPSRDAELVQTTTEALTEQASETGNAETAEKSIAVMAFVNMSDDPGNEYFSDGITEEILNLLAKIPQLRVVSRSSAFAFKGKEIHIPDVAVKLNVTHVLEGSVRKFGGQVRITAQLIEARSDTHLWSETYDRSLENIFIVQEDIAAKVVAALKLTLVDGLPSAVATNSEAHELYLQGAHFYYKRTAADYEKAIEYFKKALESDPQYVPAWSLLGATYVIQAGTGFRPYDEGYALGREASDEALRIDPDSTVLLRAWIATAYERDFALAASLYRRALELWPNSVSALNNSAGFATVIGREQKGIELVRRATKLAPANGVPYANLAQMYSSIGELENAETAASKALEMNPDIYGAPGQLALISLLRGEPELALTRADAIKLEKLDNVVRAIAHHELGNDDKSNRILQAFINQHADRYAYYIAMVYAWQDDRDSAFQWLNRAIGEGQDLDILKTDAFFKNLHSDPRWEEALMRVGLADVQVSAIEF